MLILYVIGRILFAAIFVLSGYRHIAKVKGMSAYAKSMGLPAAGFLTILSGIMILVGGIMVLFDVAMFWGALLILLFLVPTAFTMHAFWKVQEPGMKAVQQAQFLKNLSLAGAALMIMYYTYGLH